MHISFYISEFLMVKNFDLQTAKNGKDHHTSQYDLMERQTGGHLVVRRGQPFTIVLNTNHAYDQQRDKISLVFFVKGNSILFNGDNLSFCHSWLCILLPFSLVSVQCNS